MSGDLSELVDWVRKSHPTEWEMIWSHRHANEILIEFRFDGMLGDDQYRCYEVKRAPAGGFYSRTSGGQVGWTTDPAGPNGEPIQMHREWLVAEGHGYIGSFESLEMLALMIIYQLRGKIKFVVSDSKELDALCVNEGSTGR